MSVHNMTPDEVADKISAEINRRVRGLQTKNHGHMSSEQLRCDGAIDALKNLGSWIKQVFG